MDKSVRCVYWYDIKWIKCLIKIRKHNKPFHLTFFLRRSKMQVNAVVHRKIEMKPKDIFLTRLQRGITPRASVGSATSIVTTDLMDKVRIAFPDAHLEPEKMAMLAATSHTELGFDNVMPLFSVWHESAALGCRVDWGDSGRMPDGHPLCSSIDGPFHVPRNFLKEPGCTVPLKALQLLKKEVGNQVAVVGKVFGPWTLGYHVFGVEEFLISTLLKPNRVKQVMRQLLEVTVAFAEAQIEQGADALTLADHCTRDLCSPETYRDFLAEIHQELHERIRCPLILHICGDTSDRLKYIRKTELECFHFDSKVPAAEARRLAGDQLALMGGTSNIDIVRNGTAESIAKDIAEKLRVGVDIVGPECAVPLDAPYKNLKIIADITRRVSGKQTAAADADKPHR
jgi:[methyl-Co(III) methanol-specific corrinoid protein]:coenzyme M methyltransferase